MMSRKSTFWKVSGAAMVMLAAFALLWRADAVAQMPSGPSGEETEEVATDALSCWWKSDKSSLRIGEEFTVTLTCRLAETGRERTVLNDALLDPGAIVLPPYQVKNGRRYKDIIRVAPGPDGPVTFRHVQYTYTVKLMGEGFFGKDVPLPPLEIRYHIDLVTNINAVTPGKERIYLLPLLPMRIQSLVPRAGDTIRDKENDTFGDIEGRRKKAVIAFVAAGIFLLLPLFFLLPVLIRAIRGRKRGVSNGTVFRDRDLLRHLARELQSVEKKRRAASWNEESVGTALSVFRVAGALALGRRVIQTPVAIEDRGRQGQLKFRKGFWPRTKVLVSSSLTPEEMAGDLAGRGVQCGGAAGRTALLDEARAAFAAFNDARFAASSCADSREGLDGALKTGLRLLKELRRDHCPSVRVLHLSADLWARWSRPWKRS